MSLDRLRSLAEELGTTADGQGGGKSFSPVGQYTMTQTARAAAVQQTMQGLLRDLERGQDPVSVVAHVVEHMAPLATDGDQWREACMELLEHYQGEFKQLTLLHETDRGKDILEELRQVEAGKVLKALDKLSAAALRLARIANDETTALQQAIDGATTEDQ